MFNYQGGDSGEEHMSSPLEDMMRGSGNMGKIPNPSQVNRGAAMSSSNDGNRVNSNSNNGEDRKYKQPSQQGNRPNNADRVKSKNDANNKFELWLQDKWRNTDKLLFLMGFGISFIGLFIYGIGTYSFLLTVFNTLTNINWLSTVFISLIYILLSIWQVRWLILIVTKVRINHPGFQIGLLWFFWLVWTGIDCGGIFQGLKIFFLHTKTVLNFLSFQFKFEDNFLWNSVFLLLALLISLGAESTIASGKHFISDSME